MPAAEVSFDWKGLGNVVKKHAAVSGGNTSLPIIELWNVNDLKRSPFPISPILLGTYTNNFTSTDLSGDTVQWSQSYVHVQLVSQTVTTLDSQGNVMWSSQTTNTYGPNGQLATTVTNNYGANGQLVSSNKETFTYTANGTLVGTDTENYDGEGNNTSSDIVTFDPNTERKVKEQQTTNSKLQDQRSACRSTSR